MHKQLVHGGVWYEEGNKIEPFLKALDENVSIPVEASKLWPS